VSGPDAALAVRELTVEIDTPAGVIRPVDGVSFELAAGAAHGIVGESGCGKSTLLRAVIGLLPRAARVGSGSVGLHGAEGFRPGRDVAMVFQDPSVALSPMLTIGRQLTDGPRHHLGLSRTEARRRAVELLRQVGVPDPERRVRAYPHELSGGLRQRVMIAVALASEPQILLCDEPTTALDVTIQDQVLGLLDATRRDHGVGIVFVSHDLPVVAAMCSTVSVMYAGRVVESGPAAEVFARPRHPYTEGLLASAPDVFAEGRPLSGIAGAPPDLALLPDGCAFAPRCPDAGPACHVDRPDLRAFGTTRAHACAVRSTTATPEPVAATGGEAA
jgi:oligopeptide/dipeptide ABC transporter ATP-binding protein